MFRTSFTQVDGDAEARQVHQGQPSRRRPSAMIWVNNDFGKGGRDAMQKSARRAGHQGRRRHLDRSRARSTSRAPVLKVEAIERRRAVRLHQRGRVGAALRELRKQGYDKPIIGETTLTGQKVIELAGDAANGAVAHVGLTADAPQPAIKAFDQKFQAEYKYKSDHNGMKGYSGMYVVKAITEKIGKVDLEGVRRCAARREASRSRTIRACCSTSRSTRTATSIARASWSRSRTASRW